MKGQKILKVTSILMIIGGIIAAIAGVIAILGVSALAALSGSAEGTGLLYASSILVTVASVIQFIAGIKGIGACSAPQKAASCVKWGIIIAILAIISIIIGLQHHQSGAQSSAAGIVCLRRHADEGRHVSGFRKGCR
jgi:amino acid transporter